MNEAARAFVEDLLLASASKIAGDKHFGKTGGPVLWHGTQDGFVQLAERKLRLTWPRLRSGGRRRQGGAYAGLRQAQRQRAHGAWMREIVVKGVSMRKYEAVLPEVAGTVGVSKSAVSRRFIEASAVQLAALNEGRWPRRRCWRSVSTGSSWTGRTSWSRWAWTSWATRQC